MYIAAAILSVLLAAVALAAGAPKVVLKGRPPAHLQSHMGLSTGLVRFIGLAEVSAAAGLIVGLFWQPLGIAAAVGFAVLLIGAIGFHAKAGDYADPKTRFQATTPIVLASVAIAAAVTLALAL
jgi:DoxX-like protein